jgi:hypothetical protein
VVGKVSMNSKFIEGGRKTRDEVVEFGGVGISDEEIVHYKGEGGGVGVGYPGGVLCMQYHSICPVPD